MDIETPRLLLVETYSPVKEHVNWLNDKQLMRFSEQQFRTHTMDTQRAFLEEAQGNGTPTVWDIRLKPDTSESHGMGGLGATVGSFHVHFDHRHARADLGIMIGYGGQGYGSEAWEHVSHYLFYKEGFRKLEAGCVQANLAMQAILKKHGWHCEGIRYGHFVYNNQEHNLILYGKSR